MIWRPRSAGAQPPPAEPEPYGHRDQEILNSPCCPVVARGSAAPAEKWELMRQFDRVLMQQLAVTAMPQVPEPPQKSPSHHN